MTTYSGPIRLLALDVDGVLTDGTMLIGADGEIVKAFNVKDGVAVALLRVHGVETAVISGKRSASLDFRLDQLDVRYRFTGVADKRQALQDLLAATGLGPGQVAYVGDDVIDLPLAGQVGAFYAVADAHELVRRAADHVLATPGGRGAAREAAEHVLLAGGSSLEDAYARLESGPIGAQQ